MTEEDRRFPQVTPLFPEGLLQEDPIVAQERLREYWQERATSAQLQLEEQNVPRDVLLSYATGVKAHVKVLVDNNPLVTIRQKEKAQVGYRSLMDWGSQFIARRGPQSRWEILTRFFYEFHQSAYRLNVFASAKPEQVPELCIENGGIPQVPISRF